ncbi:MAG TPA: histidinol dehydrogenase [Spirochaetia bacterium]|nr:histidinol dehydrogenase [Spirochaetia bacterium]
MQVRVLSWGTLGAEQKGRILSRSEQDISQVLPRVQEIVEAVRAEGDSALVRYTRQFNAADLSGMPLAVTPAEIAEAERTLDPRVKDAIVSCAANVKAAHEQQLPTPLALAEVKPGVYAGERATPVSSVGMYAPRGKGSFPSSTYMMAMPARVAGVPRRVLVTPPDEKGQCDPATLFAAHHCGVHEIYRVGGVQALAALAYGTRSIRPVDKLLGPGNQYVTAAKRILAAVVDVGLPAGPSESMIIADGSADPHRLALDLCIEAEHGPDSQALLVTDSREVAEAVAALLPRMVAELPEPRGSYVRAVLENYGGIILTSSMDEAAEVADAVAPEHLQVATIDPLATLTMLHHAGEILLGQHTPFSLANYAIGANAVLPTGGRARTCSALSVRDFMKFSSVACLTSVGYDSLRNAAITLADYEGFAAHAKALRERKNHETTSDRRR